MPLAILAVLILIAVLIAPWLVGLVVAAAAIYGVYLVIVGGIAALCAIAIIVWALFKGHSKNDKPHEIHGGRKACKNCQCEMSIAESLCHNCGHYS